MISDRMCDFTEFYDRIAQELPDECKVVECGVADGYSALYMANRLRGLNKKFTLYMVDSLDYGGKKQLSELMKNVMLSGLSESIEIIPFDSLNASCFFNDNSLDFVFLDSSHEYAQTKAEIKLWYPKLFDGRKLAGHDYTSEENNGVRLAVDEMLPKMIVRPPIVSKIEDKDWVDYFEPEQFLHTEKTNKGLGVWWVKKNFYFKP